jgi:hypothetical protein
MGRVEALLDRYAANDQKGVIAMLDPNRITIFGSDLKEVVKTNDAVSRLMTDDFTLWHSAKFSDVRDVDVRMSDRMATTFFVASFYPGGSPNPVPVRFAMTWRNANGEWLLTQSANSVPTVGQSAAEILGKG